MGIDERRVTIGVLILYPVALVVSLLLKANVMNLLSIGIVAIVGGITLLNSERLMLLSAVTTSMLFRGLSNINSFFQYIPLCIYILMLIDIIIKKKRKRIDVVLKILVATSIFFSFIVLILNLDINIINILYTSTKRYSFIIVYIYIINSELGYEDLDSIITKPIIALLTINLPIFLFQFLGGWDRDFITGVFGYNMTGVISELLMILICLKLKDFYFKKIKLNNLFAWIIISIIYFAVAEVKFGFFVITVPILIFFMFIKREFKSIGIIVTLALIIAFGYSLYMKTYSYQNFWDADFIEYYLLEQNYSEDSINRIGFMSKIDSTILNSKIDKLFGKGIGTGNPSNFQMLQGSVFKKFDYLKYHWFTLPYLYVENGLLGMILFIATYLYTLYKGYKSYKRNNLEQGLLVFLVSIVNLMYLVYNNSILDYTIMFIYWSYFGLIEIETQSRGCGEIVSYER